MSEQLPMSQSSKDNIDAFDRRMKELQNQALADKEEARRQKVADAKWEKRYAENQKQIAKNKEAFEREQMAAKGQAAVPKTTETAVATKSGPFAPFSTTKVAESTVRPASKLGEDVGKDIAHMAASNTTTDEAGRAASSKEDIIQKNTDYDTGYRDGVVKVKRVTDKDGKTTEYARWDPVPRKIDAISDDILGQSSTITFVDAKTKTIKDNLFIPSYTRFFLEGVQMGNSERYQLIETFGQYYAYFYGSRPPIYNFSGQLLNLENYPWRLDFMHYYNNFWRGTQGVSRNGMVCIQFSYEMVYGYMLNVSTSLSSINDLSAPFQFQLLVTDVKPIPQMEKFNHQLNTEEGDMETKYNSSAYNAVKNYHAGYSKAVQTTKKIKEYYIKDGGFPDQMIPGVGQKDPLVSFLDRTSEASQAPVSQAEMLQKGLAGDPNYSYVMAHK